MRALPMPVPRLALHSIDAGFDLAARELILQTLGEPPETALTRFVSLEAMLDVQELDRKLIQAYGWADKHSWLKRSETVLFASARRMGIRTDASSQVVQAVHDMAWTTFELKQRGYARVLTLPEAEFLAVVEMSLRAQARSGPEGAQRVFAMANIFNKRCLPYRVAADGDISWVGEPQIAQTAIEPALAALADDRLANARSELAEARSELRAERFNDAVNDAGSAVETTMACLLTAHDRDLPRTKAGVVTIQASTLFDALRQHEIVDGHSKGVIMAISPLRHAGSHGAGPNPLPLSRSDAEAAVAAAAVAISYLAARMPSGELQRSTAQ